MNHKQPTSTAVKTAEEIYIECLEQYITGNYEINKVCSTQRQLSVYAMKLYANAKLDEAAEKVEMTYHCGHSKNNTSTKYHQSGADNIQINKQSILSLKDKI